MKNSSSSNNKKEKKHSTQKRSKEHTPKSSSNLKKREISPNKSPQTASKKKIQKRKKEEKTKKILKNHELVKIVKRVDTIINTLKKQKKISFYKIIKKIYQKKYNESLNLTDIINILDLEKHNLYIIDYKYDKHSREKELIIDLKNEKKEIKDFLSYNEILKREEIFKEVYIRYLVDNNFFAENRKITYFFKIGKIRRKKEMVGEQLTKKVFFRNKLIVDFFEKVCVDQEIDFLVKKKIEEEKDMNSGKKKSIRNSMEEENQSSRKKIRKSMDLEFEEENNKKVTDFFKKKFKKDLMLVELPKEKNNENDKSDIILIKRDRKEILTHLTKIINYYFQMNKKNLNKKLTTILNYLNANFHNLKKKEIEYYFDLLIDMKFLEIYKIPEKKFDYVRLCNYMDISQIIKIIDRKN